MNRHQRRAIKKRFARMQGAIEIKFKGGTRTIPFDSDDMPLILVEGMDSGKFGMMREGIADFLGLSEEESKQLTIRHLKQIGVAMKAANDIPNA